MQTESLKNVRIVIGNKTLCVIQPDRRSTLPVAAQNRRTREKAVEFVTALKEQAAWQASRTPEQLADDQARWEKIKAKERTRQARMIAAAQTRETK